MKYRIIDYEINTEKNIEAPGIIEAIAKYLPWPTLDILIHYSPTGGYAEITDTKTDFVYRVQINE